MAATEFLTAWQFEELCKCIWDCTYFVETWLWRKDAKKGKAPFKLYDWQAEILEWLLAGEDVAMNKTRQIGGSWCGASYGLWLIAFHPWKEVFFMSEKEEKAIALLDKVKFMMDTARHHETGVSGSFLFPRVMTRTQTRLAFAIDVGDATPADSFISSMTTTTDSARSFTANFVMMDEMASLPRQDETFASVKPATSRGGHWFCLSTPKGAIGTFHRLIVQGKMGNRSWRVREVHWTECPDLGTEWVRKQIEDNPMTEDLIDQEFNLVFLPAGGDAAFDSTRLLAAYMPPDENPQIRELIDKSTRFYIGVDSSEGGDLNAFIAINEYGVQVGAITSHESLDDWAGYSEKTTEGVVEIQGTVATELTRYDEMSTQQGFAYIEKNNQGLVVLNRVVPAEYSHIVVDQLFSSCITKPEYITDLILAVAGQQIIITDYETYLQCSMFQKKGRGKYGAADGYNDDAVIGLALAYHGAKAHGFTKVQWDYQAQGQRRLVQRDLKDDAPLRRVRGTGPRAQPREVLHGRRGRRALRNLHQTRLRRGAKIR